jgi:hypothetical protein
MVPRAAQNFLGVLEMRASPEIRPHLIAQRMKHWLDIAQCPLVDLRVPTWRARKNYRNLVRKYPEIAVVLEYTEALSFPSPLHGLWPSVQQPVVPAPPQQEFPLGSPNSDVTNAAPAQRLAEHITGSQPEPQRSGVPRMISLAEEVL